MKKTRMFSGLLLIILLAACGPIQTPSPTVDAPGTFTAVANTLQIGQPTFPATDTPAPPNATATVAPVTVFPTAQIISTQAATQPLYISWTPSTCDKSAFIKDVTIPDDTKFYPGTHFTKTWRIKNIGTCSWTKEYRLQYISGNKMGADTIYLSKTVAPGEELDISLEMTAPTTPEDYSNFWRLRNKAGDIFGTTFYVVIEVTKSAATLTPTGSLTNTATSTTSGTTATFTSTVTSAAATATFTPTMPPAATATSTPTTEASATSIPPSDTPVPTAIPAASDTPIP